MEEMNAISQASYCVSASILASKLGETRTKLIEIVASANGSPIMRPKSTETPLRASNMLCFFNEGEWRDPYEGMKDRKGCGVAGN